MLPIFLFNIIYLSNLNNQHKTDPYWSSIFKLSTNLEFSGNKIFEAFKTRFSYFTAQLDQWLESDNIKDLRLVDYSDFDPALEKKSWTFLRNRLQLLLGMYATSLEEDHKLLEEESSMSIYKQLAVRMRTTEKRILTTVMNYANQRMAKC